MKGSVASSRMRFKSGEVTCQDDLVCFLYLLGRDYVSLGVIEEIMLKMAGHSKDGWEYSNGWLAKYAQDVSDRLKRVEEKK